MKHELILHNCYNASTLSHVRMLIDKSFEQVKYEFEVDGFSKIIPSSDFINPLISSLSIRYEYIKKLTDSMPNKYHTQVFRGNNLLDPAYSDLQAYKDFCSNLLTKIGFSETSFDSIYATYDNCSSSHSAQSPHFDRIPTLKFMLYVNNLTTENGAFCLSNGSHHWTRKTFPLPRKDFYKPGFQQETRDIPSFIRQRLKAIEGRAGTIIIFHTDCIHNQGLVSKGSTKILRAHFRQPKRILNTAHSDDFIVF